MKQVKKVAVAVVGVLGAVGASMAEGTPMVDWAAVGTAATADKALAITTGLALFAGLICIAYSRKILKRFGIG